MKLQQHNVFAGRYRLLEHIGTGGFAVVWKASDQMADDAVVAIKIYAPERGMDSSGLKLFRKEYASVLDLQHPHILTARHFDIFEGSPYLVMPYCSGGSLGERLYLEEALPENEVAKVIYQIASALSYLHAKGVLHQDIKPDNVLMDENGDYLLTDFGISTRLRSTLRKSTVMRGGETAQENTSLTLAYAPPERFSGTTESVPASDVFSLGVMIFEMATGNVPWMGAGGGILRPESPPLELPEGNSPGIEQLVQWCTTFAPEDRPETDEIIYLSEKFLNSDAQEWTSLDSEESVAGSSQTTRSETIAVGGQNEKVKNGNRKKSKSKSRGGVTLLAVFVIVLILGGWLYWDNKKKREIEDLYYELIDRGRELQDSGNYQRALDVLEDAGALSTDLNAHILLSKEINEKQENEKREEKYRLLVQEGDSLLNSYVFQKALNKYRQAGKLDVPMDFHEERVGIAERLASLPREIKDLIANMVSVDGGVFTMGCTSEQGDECDDDERPAHKVVLSDFVIGKYEVTQGQWEAIMGENPSKHEGCSSCPVELVSWNDVQEFIEELNQRTGLDFRLPTEAEWEYAARGGSRLKYSGSFTVDRVAWYEENSDNETHPVGEKMANNFGLYDMSGNVWEWCSDWFDENYYAGEIRNNPTGPSYGSDRILRGGSWGRLARYCRVSSRYHVSPDDRYTDVGFRLVR